MLTQRALLWRYLRVTDPDYPFYTICFLAHRIEKLLKKVGKETGLSRVMVIKLWNVLGSRRITSIALDAITYTPPVTFLRTNLLKVQVRLGIKQIN